MRDKIERVRISKRAMMNKHFEITQLANQSSILFDVNKGKFNTFLNNNRMQIQRIMDEESALTEKYFETELVDGKLTVKTEMTEVDGVKKKVNVCKEGMTEEGYKADRKKLLDEMVLCNVMDKDTSIIIRYDEYMRLKMADDILRSPDKIYAYTTSGNIILGLVEPKEALKAMRDENRILHIENRKLREENKELSVKNREISDLKYERAYWKDTWLKERTKTLWQKLFS